MSFKRGGFRPPATVWMGVPPPYDGLDGGSAPLRRFGWGFRPPATVWMGVPPPYDVSSTRMNDNK